MDTSLGLHSAGRPVVGYLGRVFLVCTFSYMYLLEICFRADGVGDDVVVDRLMELAARHRHETDLETERLRSAQLQAEKLLDARERANRQRVRGLEEQVVVELLVPQPQFKKLGQLSWPRGEAYCTALGSVTTIGSYRAFLFVDYRPSHDSGDLTYCYRLDSVFSQTDVEVTRSLPPVDRVWAIILWARILLVRYD